MFQSQRVPRTKETGNWDIDELTGQLSQRFFGTCCIRWLAICNFKMRHGVKIREREKRERVGDDDGGGKVSRKRVRRIVKRALSPNMKLFRRYQQEILQCGGQECANDLEGKRGGEIEGTANRHGVL